MSTSNVPRREYLRAVVAEADAAVSNLQRLQNLIVALGLAGSSSAALGVAMEGVVLLKEFAQRELRQEPVHDLTTGSHSTACLCPVCRAFRVVPA